MPKESFNSFRKLINREERTLEKAIVFGDSLISTHLVNALKGFVEEIILVDPNEAHGKAVADGLDGIEVLHGDCTSADLLQEIHVKNVDFFIAAGKDSEDNIMACMLAKAEGAKEVIAIRDDHRHMELFESLGLNHIISPKKITSERIMESINMLPIGGLLKLRNIDLEVTHFTAEKNSRITGKPLHKLDKLFKKSIVICGVLRKGEMIIPNGNTMIKENDRVLVLCGHKNISFVNRLFKAGINL